MADVFESWSQNSEDVVLWRALHDVTDGTYVEVGANHPSWLSMTRGFYDRGWSGVTVEPMPGFAALHRETRPRDVQVEAAISSTAPAPVVLHEIDGTGLSTLVDSIGERHAEAGFDVHDVDVATVRLDDVLTANGFDERPLHFVSVDVEGAEADVLSTLDLRRFRPWVLVVEATAPLATRPTHAGWEPAVTAADYHFVLFDGLSRFYVAAEHRAELEPALSYGACVFDEYRSHAVRTLEEEVGQLQQDLARMTEDAVRWRTMALLHWSESVTRANSSEAERLAREADELRAELIAVRQTLSWRVTAPLRAVKTLGVAEPA